MSNFETLFITTTQLSADDQTVLTDNFKELIEKNGGKIQKVDNWGKKVLAYPINKEPEGVYTLFEYEGDGSTVSEFERRMRIEESVMRYMTVNLDEDIKLKAKQDAKKAKKKSIQESRETASEEDVEGE